MPSELFSVHILLPWDSIIFLDIYNPNSVSELKVPIVNFVNNLGSILSDMPSPSYLISNRVFI